MLQEKFGSLIDAGHIRVTEAGEGVTSLYYKDISRLDEKKQMAFMKGFWRVLEGDGHAVNMAAFVLGDDKTMLQLSMDRGLSEKIGMETIREAWM